MNLFEHAETNLQTEIESLRAEINRHNELYYQNDAPEIADAEFDALLAKLKSLEDAHPEYVTPDSPTQRVGGRAEGFKPFVHRVPLMSLDNSYDLDDLRAFDERCRKLADGRGFDYVAELKIDGLSVALHYENGVLTAGATRGDGANRRRCFLERQNDSHDSAQIKRRISRTCRSARRSFYGAFRRSPKSMPNSKCRAKKLTPIRAISLPERCANSIRRLSNRAALDIFPYDLLSGASKMFATHWAGFEWLEAKGFHTNPHRALCRNFDELAANLPKKCRVCAIRSITILTAWSSK